MDPEGFTGSMRVFADEATGQMVFSFSSVSVVLTWLHRANIYPERVSPLGPSTLSLLFLVQMFLKSPLVLRPCLPLPLPRRGHYLIKKNSSLTPTLSPPLLFNMQFSAVNSQNPKPTQSFLIFSPLILLSLLLWKIFVAPHQSCFAKIPSWQSFYFLLKLTLMAT